MSGRHPNRFLRWVRTRFALHVSARQCRGASTCLSEGPASAVAATPRRREIPYSMGLEYSCSLFPRDCMTHRIGAAVF